MARGFDTTVEVAARRLIEARTPPAPVREFLGKTAVAGFFEVPSVNLDEHIALGLLSQNSADSTGGEA